MIWPAHVGWWKPSRAAGKWKLRYPGTGNGQVGAFAASGAGFASKPVEELSYDAWQTEERPTCGSDIQWAIDVSSAAVLIGNSCCCCPHGSSM